MNKKLTTVFSIAACILIFDYLTKLWIFQNVAPGSGFAVWPGYFDIVHGHNRGAAFGILQDWHSPWRDAFFYAMAVIAFVIMLNFLKGLDFKTDRLAIIALGMITGGALGNILDRATRGFVVDFLSFHFQNQIWQFELFGRHFVIPLTWPAFNVADSAITSAVVLLLIHSLRQNKSNP